MAPPSTPYGYTYDARKYGGDGEIRVHEEEAAIVRQIQADVEGGVFTTVGNPLNRGTDYNINLSNQALFGGVDVTAVDFGGSNQVTYDTLGAPSAGGTVTLAFGTRQVVVTLDSLTGKVTVSE